MNEITLPHVDTTPTNPRHMSESAEHYTPKRIVDAAHEALGWIDLDPASCEEANKTVEAAAYFTRELDGYTKEWHGRVFLNPPGGLSDAEQRPVKPNCKRTGSCGLTPGHKHVGSESSQRKWWRKLVAEYLAGRVERAVFVCFSLELLQTTQEASVGSRGWLPLHWPICYPSKRIAYLKTGGAVGKAPPHSSAIVFLGKWGEEFDGFVKAFTPIGHVVIPYEWATT